MFRMIVLAPLACGVLLLSACAESLHQVQRESERLGVPLGLEKEIDTSVTFADLKRSPGAYVGRTVMIGGKVIRAKLMETGTEVEVLQLPTATEGGPTEDRLQSEGRFLAVRQAFLDPASLPEGTPITVIGAVQGAATRRLDESEYTYPILEIKHIIDWKSVAAQRPSGDPFYYGPYFSPFYYPPVGFGGFYPYGGYPGGYWGGYRGGSGFYRPVPHMTPRSSPPPPPRSVPPNLRRR
jgi:outer membrane lipoprotein